MAPASTCRPCTKNRGTKVLRFSYFSIGSGNPQALCETVSRRDTWLLLLEVATRYVLRLSPFEVPIYSCGQLALPGPPSLAEGTNIGYLDGIRKVWSEPVVMQQERRLCRRKPLEQLAYISLASDNGGIVLDVSEGGLGFHAVAPVEAGEPIHFRFPVRPVAGIEVVGEVVWKDETGKSGGLRFTHLPDEVREQIRIWSGPPRMNLPVVPVSAPTTEIKSAPASKDDLAFAEANQPLSGNRKPSPFTAPVNPLSMFPPEPRSAAGGAVATRHHSVSSRHSVTALVLTIVLASVIAIGIASYVYMREAGESLVHLGEKIRGGSRSQPVMPAPAPPTSSRPNTPKTTQTVN